MQIYRRIAADQPGNVLAFPCSATLPGEIVCGAAISLHWIAIREIG
jgi:hypothetical protein